MSVPLLREELVEASVLRAVTTGLASLGFVQQPLGFSGPTPNVVVREAFPTADERAQELTATTIAFGFNIDDGGVAAEMGTSRTKYVHTLVAWVFALEPRFGRKVAYGIRTIVKASSGLYGIADTIPLLDFNASPTAPPQIDVLPIIRAPVEHQGNSSVRPYDRFVWTVGIEVQDIN